jgi:hypothetical protein
VVLAAAEGWGRRWLREGGREGLGRDERSGPEFAGVMEIAVKFASRRRRSSPATWRVWWRETTVKWEVGVVAMSARKESLGEEIIKRNGKRVATRKISWENGLG